MSEDKDKQGTPEPRVTPKQQPPPAKADPDLSATVQGGNTGSSDSGTIINE